MGKSLIQSIFKTCKPWAKWAILGIALFFLFKAFKEYWQEVKTLQIQTSGWACLCMALGVTLSAHIWSGWVWGLILREFNYPIPNADAVIIYLQTNIGKYLPGNVWHFYGRIKALTARNINLGVAVSSVVLEPLLMAACALIVTLGGYRSFYWWVQIAIAILIFVGIHPRFLNIGLSVVQRLKDRENRDNPEALPSKLKRYPFRPILGVFIFLALRGLGFILTLLPFTSVQLDQIPVVISGFSFAWVLGLVVPGAPGGVGIFEATVIAVLRSEYSPGVLLGSVAFYRLISVGAEGIGAGLAWLDQRRLNA